jgi:hypothetical protein
MTYQPSIYEQQPPQTQHTYGGPGDRVDYGAGESSGGYSGYYQYNTGPTAGGSSAFSTNAPTGYSAGDPNVTSFTALLDKDVGEEANYEYDQAREE